MATAEKVLAAARGELGVKESPAASNTVKYNTWYYNQEVSGPAYPWCMVFVQWCFAQAAASGLLPVRTASCGELMRAAQRAGLWVTGGYRPGDVVIYDCGRGAPGVPDGGDQYGQHPGPRPQGGRGVGTGERHPGGKRPGGSDAIPALDPAAVLYHDVQVCQTAGPWVTIGRAPGG